MRPFSPPIAVERAACARTIVLVLLLCGCSPDTSIEPIPSPTIAPDAVATSAVPKGTPPEEAVWVTVAAPADTVIAGRPLSLRNERTGVAVASLPALDGGFALTIAAATDDALVLGAFGYPDLVLVTPREGANAPAAPCLGGRKLVVSAPDEALETTVSGEAGCLAPGDEVVASSTAAFAVTVAPVDDAGAFSLRLAVPPASRISLFARRGTATSPAVSLTVPTGRDDDEDGVDAAFDCDDTSANRRPGVDERCDGRDDDCDGVVDEFCLGNLCTMDADCPQPHVCFLGICLPMPEPGEDRDGDEVPDGQDRCPTVYDPAQTDLDGDQLGDACDTDADGDGFLTTEDCDDLNALVAPVFGDTCGDGLDNDCDGTTDDACAQRTCVDDADCVGLYGACLVGGCDAVSGGCVGLPDDGASCDDGNLCTRDDTCTAGACAGRRRDCADADPATVDTCEPTTGACRNEVACTADDECTGEDVCVQGRCLPPGPGPEPTGALHVQLTWVTPSAPAPSSVNGGDLDLHLIHPDAPTRADAPDLDGDGAPDPYFDPIYDCDWYNRTPDWGRSGDAGDDPVQDIDDVDGDGPESINLDEPEALVYRVAAYYSNDRSVGASTPTVKIYLGGELVDTIEGPSLVKGDLWCAAFVDIPGRRVVSCRHPVTDEPWITPSYPNERN